MSYFRYVVSIIANLILMVIGGVLSFLGVAGAIASYRLYAVLEQKLPNSDVTLNESLGAVDDRMVSMDMTADMTPWLIIAGKLVIGLALLFFGIRGLIGRFRDGPPDESEDMPSTASGRIGHVLLYGAGGLVGLKFMIFALIGISDHVILAVSGVEVQAVITENRKSNGEQDEESGVRYAIYSFRTAAGEQIKSKVMVPNFRGREFAQDNTIVITYLPSNPEFNQPVGIASFSGFFMRLIFYSILIVGGFWGVMRNIGGGFGSGEHEAT